jgi:hypothetical protein
MKQIFLVVGILLSAQPSYAELPQKIEMVSAIDPKTGDLNFKSYILKNPNDLAQLKFDIDHLSIKVSKGTRLGLSYASELLDQSLNEDSLKNVAEIIYSYNSNFMYPAPKSADLIELPFYLDNYIGMGRTEANDLIGKDSDLSKRDPPASSFWSRPANISEKDLYVGFDRKEIPDLTQTLCYYKEPKDGWGVRGGFAMICNGQEIKAKWGIETHSEPFNSRIFWALGYNVNIVDFAPALRISYDRRLFLEYNSRKPFETKISVFLIPVTSVQIGGNYEDPFSIVDHAVLKNGETVSGELLRSRLVKGEIRSELDMKKYDSGFESQIDYLIMKPGNVEYKDPLMMNIGGWAWSDIGYFNDDEQMSNSTLNHENLRALRGTGLLAAWLNSYDVRTDNNRLRIYRDEKGQLKLKHFISDLGAGLGSANTFMTTSAGVVGDMKTSFTVGRMNCESALGQVYKNMCKNHGFAIQKYQSVEANTTFQHMTKNDARWMARLIAALTPIQIRDALIASGFSAAEVEMYQVKLGLRRDHMVEDLEINPEWDKQFEVFYKNRIKNDPRFPTRDYSKDPLIVQLQNGETFRVDDQGCNLKKGNVRCE